MDKKSSQYELILKAQGGSEEAKEALFENNIGLVKSTVKKFLHRGYEAEDLFQVGAIGLIKAIEKFDLSFDVKFSTYAVPMIMGEIKRYIRDDGIIKVSRSVKELAFRAAAAREALLSQKGEEPKISEIAEQVGACAEEVAAAIEAVARPESIYAAQDNGSREGLSVIDRLECKENEEERVINRLLISSALKDFSKREQRIIILRYFGRKTQTQIAKDLGISQVQVSRIEKKVLAAMKEKLSENN